MRFMVRTSFLAAEESEELIMRQRETGTSKGRRKEEGNNETLNE